VLSGGRTPQDHYWAFANRRTVAVHSDLLAGGAPTIDFTADDTHVLGSRVAVDGPGTHTLRVAATDLPPGARVALVGAARGQAAPVQLGTVDADGTLDAATDVASDGSDWWFAVVCLPGPKACGSDQTYSAVTAPIWFE
jgi:hypothetical protein